MVVLEKYLTVSQAGGILHVVNTPSESVASTSGIPVDLIRVPHGLPITLPAETTNHLHRIQSDSLNPKRFALWLLWPGEQAMNPLEFRQLCQTFLLAQPLPYPWFRVSASYDHHYRLTT